MDTFISSFPPIAKYIVFVAYMVLIIYTVIRILLDTHSASKTLAYLLLIFIVPLLGIFFYYTFGLNYRHHNSTKERTAILAKLNPELIKVVPDNTSELLKANPKIAEKYIELIHFISNLGKEFLGRNEFKLLLNGEEKFPEVLRTLKTAENFIHMEYYAWENDVRGNQIKELLIKKVSAGVKVRVMFDDYASKNIKRNIVKELRNAGVEIYPVLKVKLARFASRMNHRDHRKLIIVDGHTGFIGGINISDRYDNSIDTGLYWRDTHVKIMGDTVHNMQRHFIVNWNACQKNKLEFTKELFPTTKQGNNTSIGNLAQIVAGGPIYPMSTIMLSYFKIFTVAKEKLYITNPYFIPSESIMDALKQAAVSGVDVRLMLPEKSDSAIVGAASKFYFRELLQAGVRIFLYKKGFVHAKTVVVDKSLSVVGTANMDIRSFDLNFEIMSVIYDEDFATGLEKAYVEDLEECKELSYSEWLKLGTLKRLGHAFAKLISSFL